MFVNFPISSQFYQFSSNLPAPINVGSTEQTKAGNLIIGGVLRLGQYATDPSGTEGALYYNTTDKKTKIYSSAAWSDLGGGASLWVASGTAVAFDNDTYIGGDIYLKGIKISLGFCDNDNDGHYAENFSVSCQGLSSGTAGDDCDDFCTTCYPGSTSWTAAADGYDQNCNGTVDESEAIRTITLCAITSTYEMTCTTFCANNALECFGDSYATCDLSYGSCARSQALTGWATNYRCDCGVTNYHYY